ncbi:MAG TPA: type II toxin-antitoxin system HicB family antitoxin [Phycisphaerae bacterium]|nr:type II toxin-antitoxin system HicB family antitoxin [Phycisphaerae bacterium]HPL79699.1 type II toxin-antitoxin system HicB family antitoxin [Burkholderiaceae bacterium]
MKITILIRARADGQYVANCPSLPGCVASANTRESAQHKMREAVVGYVASMDAVVPANVTFAEVQESGVS